MLRVTFGLVWEVWDFGVEAREWLNHTQIAFSTAPCSFRFHSLGEVSSGEAGPCQPCSRGKVVGRPRYGCDFEKGRELKKPLPCVIQPAARAASNAFCLFPWAVADVHRRVGAHGAVPEEHVSHYRYERTTTTHAPTLNKVLYVPASADPTARS